MTRILIVDDEDALAHALAVNLRAHGHTIDVATNGQTALRTAASHPPDLVILDLGLPDLDGVDVVRGLRGWLGSPIIILSAREAQAEKVAALDAGADDYMTKPFGMDELLARVRAALRRRNTGPQGCVVKTETFTADLSSHKVTTSHGEVRLTPTEWHLLEMLMRHPGQLVTQRQLLQEVWGPGYGGEANYLRVYVSQLRRKLEKDPTRPRHIVTDPGVGYRFDP